MGDSVRAREVQRAIDVRGLASVGPVAFVGLNDGDSRTFEEGTTRALRRRAPREAGEIPPKFLRFRTSG